MNNIVSLRLDVVVCSWMVVLLISHFSSSFSSGVRAFVPLISTKTGGGVASCTRSRVTAASLVGTTTTALRMISIMDLLSGGGGAKNQLIDPKRALPGRTQPMAGIDGLKHYVLKNPIQGVPDGQPQYKEAIFANGCFWGTEKSFWRLPQGIYSTAVGYCAGFTPNPTYEEACSGQTGHTEGCRVVYDETQISFVDLLRMFWESHDPTSGMGQGNDRGTQYRSGFYYTSEEQQALIVASRDAYEQALATKSGNASRKITTEIQSANHYDQYGTLWYYAEPYHQQYLAKPGSRPYCSAQPQGVSLPSYDTWCPFPDNSTLKEKHRPKLPESFWSEYGPKRGCSVVTQSNAPIQLVVPQSDEL